MRLRLFVFFVAVVTWGATGFFLPGTSGLPSRALSSGTASWQFAGSGKDSHGIGVPLPDKDIRLRATGIGVYPIQVLPGVIFDESGPVKLWDEVSMDGNPEGTGPVGAERSLPGRFLPVAR